MNGPRLPLVLLGLLLSATCCLGLALSRLEEPPTPPEAGVRVEVAVSRPTPVPTWTPTATPRPSPTVTTTPGPPTPTNTRVVNPQLYRAATDGQPTDQPQASLTLAQLQMRPPTATPPPGAINYSRTDRVVLAHYFAWFDGDGWDDCNISAGDKPLRPYHSDDPAVIARHIQMGLDVGLNGFALHWFAPNDRTERNFATLLAQSEGRPFAATVVFSRHIYHGQPRPNRQNIAEALSYILQRHGNHPNFLRLEGKPVLFFTDVYRVPAGAGESAPQFWANLRDQVDPERQSWWIAEGLDPAYLAVFDGLYVFKITHATSLHDYEKSPQWGNAVRQWEQETNRPKLWIATISPGWDDLRSGCKPDVRAPNTPHRLDRANGAIYEATFQAAIASHPDWLIVGSFNEWVEGSYIEPSVLYGDKYMRLTAELTGRFRQQ